MISMHGVKKLKPSHAHKLWFWLIIYYALNGLMQTLSDQRLLYVNKRLILFSHLSLYQWKCNKDQVTFLILHFQYLLLKFMCMIELGQFWHWSRFFIPVWKSSPLAIFVAKHKSILNPMKKTHYNAEVSSILL